jgi:hypothetical protein
MEKEHERKDSVEEATPANWQTQPGTRLDFADVTGTKCTLPAFYTVMCSTK